MIIQVIHQGTKTSNIIMQLRSGKIVSVSSTKSESVKNDLTKDSSATSDPTKSNDSVRKYRKFHATVKCYLDLTKVQISLMDQICTTAAMFHYLDENINIIHSNLLKCKTFIYIALSKCQELLQTTPIKYERHRKHHPKDRNAKNDEKMADFIDVVQRVQRKYSAIKVSM
jgi:hypothetical protein